MDDLTNARRKATKKEISRQLRRYLRNAREKEMLVLTGFAQEFCRVHELLPEQIELVRKTENGDAVFFFRKREGALILPRGTVL